MTAAVAITITLTALLVVGVVIRHPHRHMTRWMAIHGTGVDHTGVWEVCRCGAARMSGDRRWRHRPPAGVTIGRPIKS